MKIAVISDTHRDLRYIEAAKKYIRDTDILIHLGDNIDDVQELSKGYKGKVYAVKGNCDYLDSYPSEQIIDVEGKKIFFTHGHNYGVKMSLNNIYYKGKEVGADIVLFGHTHVAIIEEEDGIILMNPGSISLPRINGRYIGFINIEKEKDIDIYLKEVN
ncbi:MAG: metallophosphoesterase [Clostridium sp.]|nr:metallophosphoesterase [Clostridium sp.]